MLTLSFGFKKPENGDLGSIVFPALEDNIQQLNDHSHDGVDSTKIVSGSLDPTQVSIAAGSWVLVGNGLYKQTITLPGTLTYDKTSFTVKLSGTGHLVHPTIEKVSATQYDIYTNDNSVGFEVSYL